MYTPPSLWRHQLTAFLPSHCAGLGLAQSIVPCVLYLCQVYAQHLHGCKQTRGPCTSAAHIVQLSE